MPDASSPREPRPELLRGECHITVLRPQTTGLTAFFRKGTVYDFDQGGQLWELAGHAEGYILGEAAVVDNPGHQRRFSDLMVVHGGHVAIGGAATGWRKTPTQLSGEVMIPAERLAPVGYPALPPSEWVSLSESFTAVDGSNARLRNPQAVAKIFDWLIKACA